MDTAAGARDAYGVLGFRSRAPLPRVARVDRAYRVRPGKLVLLELKTRRPRCAYLSDVIELSAQRVAAMAATGEALEHYGYVLTARPVGKVTGCHRLALLTYADLTAKAIARLRARAPSIDDSQNRASLPAVAKW